MAAQKNNTAQKFANNAGAFKEMGRAKAMKQAATAAVLNNFSLEQNRSQLRVVDGDGSIYSGSIEVVQAANKDWKAPRFNHKTRRWAGRVARLRSPNLLLPRQAEPT